MNTSNPAGCDLSKERAYDIIRPLPWSGIEVVITGLTRNQFVGLPARGFESHPLRIPEPLIYKA